MNWMTNSKDPYLMAFSQGWTNSGSTRQGLSLCKIPILRPFMRLSRRGLRPHLDSQKGGLLLKGHWVYKMKGEIIYVWRKWSFIRDWFQQVVLLEELLYICPSPVSVFFVCLKRAVICNKKKWKLTKFLWLFFVQRHSLSFNLINSVASVTIFEPSPTKWHLWLARKVCVSLHWILAFPCSLINDNC